MTKYSESILQSDSGYRSIAFALRMDCINGKFANRFFILSWFLNYKSKLNKWIKIGVPVLVTDNCESEEYQDMLGHLANI